MSLSTRRQPLQCDLVIRVFPEGLTMDEMIEKYRRKHWLRTACVKLWEWLRLPFALLAIVGCVVAAIWFWNGRHLTGGYVFMAGVVAVAAVVRLLCRKRNTTKTVEEE